MNVALAVHPTKPSLTLPGIARRAAQPSYLRPVTMPTAEQTLTAALQQIGTTLTYSRDTTAIEEGNPAEYVFKVVSGALRSVRLLADGRRHITDFLLPGDFFGFSASDEYTQTIEAVADSSVVRYPRAALESLLERDGRASRLFFSLICKELSEAQDHLLLLGRKNAMERMATFLVAMAERAKTDEEPQSIELPMSRCDIADYLGLTIETVSRLFSQLRSRKLIGLPTANHIVFLNREGLADICDGG